MWQLKGEDVFNHTNIVQYMFHGEIFKDDISVSAVLAIRYDEHGHEPVECDVLIKKDEKKSNLWVSNLSYTGETIQARGTNHEGRKIWIPKLRIVDTSSGTDYFLKGTADLYVEEIWGGAFDNFENSDDSVNCYLAIPYTHLTTLKGDAWTDNNTVYHHRKQETTDITWETSLGKAELIRDINTVSTQIGLKKAKVNITECRIKLVIASHKINDLESFIDELNIDQDEVLWLLSFLSKKRIVWYRATFNTILVRRKSDFIGREANEVKTMLRLLVQPDELRNKTFEQMYSKLKESPYAEGLIGIIQNLMTTYESNYLEGHLAMMYTIFEMLVSELADEKISYNFEEGEFSVLKEQLEKEVKKILKANDVNSKIRSDVYAKLPELRRKSYETKIMLLLNEHGLLNTQYWSEEVDFINRLKLLISRRNTFIHQGKIIDYSSSYEDYILLRYVISVWLAKLLGLEKEKLNPYDSDLNLIKMFKPKGGHS